MLFSFTIRYEKECLKTPFPNPNYSTTRIFEKKIPRHTTKGFYHLQAFLKAIFIPQKQTNVICCFARDQFEIFHDPLPGRDLSVEKRCLKTGF